MTRDGSPSPHGMRFIIGVHQGYIPFPLGHGLFKDMYDATTIIAIIRDPIQSLTIGKRLVFGFGTIVA